MKFLSKAIATVALLALPTMAQAQYDVNLRATGWPINVGPNGGQFQLTTTSIGAGSNLGVILGYCIDPTRGAPFDAVETYRVFTFAQYVSATLGSNYANSQFTGELNQMAINAGIIATNGVAPVSTAAQQNTWAMFTGAGNTSTNPTFNNAGWVVLVSTSSINATSVRGGQTFIAQTVPEPSTYALMGVGLFAISMVARRRRQS